jgi:uncharacterized protein (UPF0262 family)
MADSYILSGAKLTTSFVSVYTAPTTSLMKSLHVSSHCTGVATGEYNVSVKIYDSSESQEYYLINSGLVPYQAALNLVDNTIVLNSNDEVRVAASTGLAMDCIGSFLEIS